MQSHPFAKFCYKDDGTLKPKNECRAQIINQLILEEGRGVDESEDIADKAIRELDLWEPKLAQLKQWLSDNPED